jgi:O-6-methylguanine DNA methyltransferase
VTYDYSVFSSRVGELLVAGTAHAVTHVTRDVDAFIKRDADIQQAASDSTVGKAATMLYSYLQGAIAELNIVCDTGGTAFQQAVWNELLNIPYGTTSSYTEVAKRIGKPTAFRAVANACGQNPMPIIIPCHRVVHKSGNVSGFAWGVEAKLTLLELEATPFSQTIAA